MELRSARCLRQGLLTSTALAGLGILPAAAGQLPTGYATSFGSVGFSRSSGTLNINQSSQSAIVNYNSFSIGRRARVDIHQPGASSVLLNRVTGATRSVIAGRLTANGQVYLINPNGIAITRSGAVKVGGGFVASSLGMTDEEFKSGRTYFSGSNAGRVSNRGTITIGRGGYAALIGGKVMNGGTIAVPMGTVAMGAGEMATLDVSGDGFLQVGLPSTAGGKGALITNTGRIDGVTVMVDAATARAAARNVVNIAGTIDSHTISGHSGSIQIGGSGGTVAISGHLSVASRHATGGAVTITGDHIVMHHAHVMARGATGGGTVKIGGDFHGGGTLAHAGTVTIDKKSIITADATAKGNGGSVVVWSDETTRFAGLITARGGAHGGDGGETEVSSHGKLAYTGWTVLTARRGAMGTLLLDPENVTISTAADAGQSGFTATADNSTINSTTLLKALGTANVTVSTGSTGNQAGTITLAATTPLAWTTGATLTLQAASDITLNSAVTAGAGGLTLASGGTISATGAVSVARFTLTSGNWVQNSATLPGFSAGDFQVNGGSFLRAAGGAGTTASPYLLTDIYGVQGMGTSATYLAASYQLVNSIDASGTATWNGGAGFAPVGNGNTFFTGALNGAGYSIVGLTINRPSTDDVGLIGELGYPGRSGSVSNLGLLGGSVSGHNAVGGLVGSANRGSIISQTFSTAAVTGSNSVGGLVGYSYGSISHSYSTGAVNAGSGSFAAGGLVGYNLASIDNAYSTGAVTAGSGSRKTGGLVGENDGSISQAYSSGAVSSAGGTYVGGLVGENDGTLTATYWDTQTTGRGNTGIGAGISAGAIGLTAAQARSQAGYTNATDSTQSFDFTDTWYQAGDMRPILRSEAAPAVNGVIPVSNLDQLALIATNLAGSYALTGNIDASATNSTAASSGVFGAGGFAPIGNSATPFTGSLNGAGHTITGLTINLPGQSYVGLIGDLGTSGSITGLGLVGGNVTGGTFVGGLVGYNQGSIAQIYNTGGVSASQSSYVGGLVGYNTSSGSIAQAYDTGAVTTEAGDQVGGLVGENYGSISQAYGTGAVTGGSYLGGLVGDNKSGGSITEAYSTGSVTGFAVEVGGLVGENEGSISQAYSTGAATGAGGVGGLVGADAGSISQTYASGAVTDKFTGDHAGGLIGRFDNGGTIVASFWDTQTTGQGSGFATGNNGTPVGATGLSTTSARGGLTYYTGFDTTAWYQAGDMRPILRSEAASAVNGVIPVSNLDQLALVATNLAGSYALTGNIDASATNSTAASAGIWGAGGFVPIGNSTTPFAGSLNGAGHTITGLTIDLPSQSYVGLIGNLGAGGSVSGLGLVGGSVSGSNYVGALVGENHGKVSQSYATGSVSGSVSLSSEVGGLVGENDGTVSQSYATGSVSGSQVVGGLVGENDGTVSQSYATGGVAGELSEFGGLVGFNDGTVSQSYATGNVTGSDSGFMGGLVGLNLRNGSVSQSYAIGSVSGGSGSADVGGLIGYNAGTLTATYWNTTTNAVGTVGVGMGTSAGVTGLSTAQMTDLSAYATNFAGFDFANVWAPPNQVGQNNNSATAYYPQLYALSNVVAVTTPTISRSYGSANPGLIATYTGLQPGDFVTSLGTLSTSATASSNAGSYAATASGTAVTAASGTAYRILYAPGTLQVTPAPLTVSGTKVYDTSAGFGTGQLTVTGAQNSETVTLAAGTGTATSADVGVYAGSVLSGLTIAVSGGNGLASNYQLPATGTLAITPATITVAAATGVNKTYDGSTALPAGVSGFTSSGVLGNDAVTVTAAFAAYTSANAGAEPFTVSGLTLSGAKAMDYTLSAMIVSGSGIITPRAVTLSGTQVYNGTTGVSASNLTVTNLVTGDTAGLGGTGTMTSRNAGSNGLVSANGALAGFTLANGNYTLAGGSGSVNVTPEAITVTAAAGSKTYDGTSTSTATPTITTGAIQAGDTATLSERYGTANAGNGLTLTPTAVIADGNGGANYTVSYVGSSNGIITPRAVTLSGTQVYDGTTGVSASNLTVTNLVTGDTAGLGGTGTMTSRNVGTNALVSANGALTGFTLANGNYTLAGGSGSVAVTPEAITVTAAAGSKGYDGTTTSAATPTITTGAIQAGDTATLSESYGTANAGNGLTLTPTAVIADGNGGANYTVSYVGSNGIITPRAVTLSGTQVYDGTTGVSASNLTVTNLVTGDTAGLGGTGTMTSRNVGTNALVSANGALTGFTLANGNYTLAGGSGSVAVTPEAITVTAAAGSKTYDGTTTSAAAPTITTGAIQAGDTATLSESYGTANAGNGLTLTPTAVIADGNGGANYTVSYVGSSNGTITPATLTYVALAAKSTYGSTPAGLTGTVSGFVDGQTAASATTGTLVFTTQATGSSNVGSYAISGSGLTANDGNYVFAQASGNATALAVKPAALTVSGSKTYDGTTGFATGQLAVSGAVNGETVSLTSGTGTTASADAGSYLGSSLSNLGIQVSGGNAMASNYMLPGTGTLTIGKATITVAGATGVDKTYDGTTALPFGSSGFTTTGIVGSNVTVSATSASYAGANAGSEAVNVIGLTIAGAGAGDYVLSSTSVQGSGTITPATVVVSANGGRSIYGNVPGNPGLSASGLQDGQNVGVLTGLSSSFALTDRTHAGSYTLSVQGVMTNGNYRVVGTNDGVFIVDPRALTVTANNQSRRFGQANPPLTYAIGGMGLVNGDTLAGALTTPAMKDSRGGAYAIQQGTLAASSDYALTYVPGTLVVGPAPLTVTSGASVVTPASTISAAGLASTAERADQQVLGLLDGSLPLSSSTVGDIGATGAQIVGSLTNPRFDEIVVCVKDLCTFAAPRPKPPMKRSSLENPR